MIESRRDGWNEPRCKPGRIFSRPYGTGRLSNPTQDWRPGLSSARAVQRGLKDASVRQPLFPCNRPLLLVIPTRISCHAALDTVACAPFSCGKAHEVRQRHQSQQEIRGSEASGSAVRHSCAPLLPAHNLHPSSPNPDGNTNLPFVIPGFHERPAELQIPRLARDDKKESVVARKGRLLNRNIFQP